MSELVALIFDVDGTLADTERDGHRVAFNQAFVAAGLDWEWAVPLYGELLKVTGGKERIRYYLDYYNTAFPRPADLDGFIKQLHADKTRYYTEMLALGMIPLRRGVKRLLDEARKEGVRLAIATTTTPENIVALLQNTKPPIPESWFEVIAAGEIVPAKKPAPDIYLYTLQQLGLRPEQCLAIEDSENGLLSACRAGLPTVVTVNDYTRAQDFTEAALVIDDMGEPGRPFSVLNGADVHGHTYLNLALLRRIRSGAMACFVR
ncbi:MAG: HAD family hydrolase [Gammaproteobacteria bacterium]